MRNFAIVLIVVFLGKVSAQTFTANPNSTAQCSQINISSLPSSIDGSFGLETVCINLTHFNDQDLDIILTAPDGTVIELSTGNGGMGDDYTNTCFTMTAATSITTGTAPFTGTYIPEGNLSYVNNSQNPNGIWEICVINNDIEFGSNAQLIDWSITFANNVSSIEICDDGIDNDLDGLIDLNDSDCDCNIEEGYGVTSLIPNPSFEDHTCCPDNHSQLTCADNWIQAGTGGTSDYYNTCDYTYGMGDFLQPYDGDACVGFYAYNVSSTQTYNEYVGTCLSTPLTAGVAQQLTFNLAFKGGVYCPTLPPQYYGNSIDITLYGNPNCNATTLPFDDDGGNDCPLDAGTGWIALGTITINPADILFSWDNFSINFTPSVDINAVIIGPPCNTPADFFEGDPPDGCSPYFLLDNLILNTEQEFEDNAVISIESIGNSCTNQSFTATASTTGTYQWYYEGVAIPGETNSTIDITGNNYLPGTYQLMFTFVAGCIIDEITYTLEPPLTNAIDIDVCSGGSYTYADGTTSNNITINENNISTLTAANGCDSVLTENINVLPIATSTNNITITSGDDYTYADGTTHTNITADENYTSTLVGAALNGCDSIVNEILQITSAEDCFDGIDNDGDGLIDMNDPDCDCTTAIPLSIIPNPSFEDMDCCPTESTSSNSVTAINCVSDYSSMSGGSPDYWNSCGWLGGWNNDQTLIGNPLFPFPDGNAAVGTFVQGGWVEYIGACLLSPMLAGQTYELTFNMAFEFMDVMPMEPCGSTTDDIHLAPIDMTIYGTTTCDSIPFSTASNSYMYCPTTNQSWVELGHVTVDPATIFQNWTEFTISFTIGANDIVGYAFGPPCTLPTGTDNYGWHGDCAPYFFFDNMILNEENFIPNPVTLTIDTVGGLCSTVTLTAEASEPGTYQWYYEGVALVGETGLTINVSGNVNAGEYSVTFFDDANNECVTTSIQVVPEVCDCISVPPSTGTPTPTSILPNSSFEDYSNCPTNYSQTAFVDGWGQGSEDGTSDYMNTCGYIAPAAPQPFPSGNGIMAAIFASSAVYVESIGSCLLSPMLADTTYELTLSLAFNFIDANGATGYELCSGAPTNLDPINLTIFGTADCSNLPFEQWSQTWCPTQEIGWVELGHVTVDPYALQGTWGSVTINFTPGIDINAIVLGPPCNIPATWQTMPCMGTFFFDDLVLNSMSSSVVSPLTVDSTGNSCTNLIFTAHTDTIGTYQWTYEGVDMPGETDSILDITGNNYQPGDYEVTFTYGTNPVYCITENISFVDAPIDITVSNDTTICEGNSVTLTATGADTYAWDNGLGSGASQTVTPTSTTTYTVTGTTGGCTDTETVTVTTSPAPDVDDIVDQDVCDTYTLPTISGTNLTGSEAYFTGTNGTGTQYNAGDIINSDITLYIYDGVATCDDEESFNITITPITFTVSGVSPTTCGGNDGYITISGLTANTVYQISYNNGSVQGPSGMTSDVSGNIIINGLPAGSYTDFIVELNGCSTTDNTIINLVEPGSPSIGAGTDQTVCDGEQVTLTATNTDNANISWSPVITDGVAFTPNLGTTTYTVTANLLGCISTDLVDVIVNPIPVINAGTNQTVCDGEQVTLTASNPNSASISWDNGITDGVAFTPSVGTTTYTVTADLNTCIATDDVNVTVNPLPTFSLAGTDPSACGVSDGFITISGLTVNTVYQISYNNGSVQGPTNMTSDASGNIIINGLPAGSYTDFIVELNGCSTTDNTIINLVEPGSPSIGAGTDQTVCDGEQVTLTATNPDNANISWSPVITDGVAFTPSLGTTTYTVTANLLGCISTDLVDVIVNPIPVINAGTNQTVCDGEQVTLTASNPNSASISWDNGITDGVAFTPSVGTTTYTVTADLNGCSSSDNLDVTVIANPTPVITGIDFCQGASTTLDAGAGYQSYSWNPTTINTQIITITGGGTYQVEVTDINGCTNIANITITMHATPSVDAGLDVDICEGENTSLNATSSASSFAWDNGLGAGSTHAVTPSTTTTYTVGVVDANGCTNSDNITVNVHSIPTISINPNDISCNGLTDGSIDLTVNGGQSPYIFDWSNGQHTEDLSNLSANNYSVTVSDNYNCESTNSAQISEPSGMILNISSANAGCYGDADLALDLSVSGGTTPYNYEWNNGAQIEDLVNITAGNYIVTVTDNSGCVQMSSINISEPSELIVELPSSYTHCNHNTDILSSVNGGTVPYTYLWSTGSTSQQISYTPNTTQTYTITVTDNNGCTSSNDITITISSVELNVYSNNDTVCPGDPVLITTNIAGGIPPYTIYDNGQITSFPIIIYPNNSDYYNLTVVDACGNTDDANINIHTYPIPVLSFNSDILSGCVPLTVNFNVENNIAYTNYNWIFGNDISFGHNPTYVFQNSGVFDVSLSVTTTDGCVAQQTISNMITVHPKPDAQFEALPDVVSFLNPTVGFVNYSEGNYYNFWSFGDGDSSITVEPSHTYPYIGTYNAVLVVETQHGCLDSAIHLITVKDEYTLYVPTAFSPDNDGINDGFRAVGNGIDLDNFYIAVYDRWGEVIWSSTNLYENWDGKAKGGDRLVQIGTYKWLVICKDFKGVEHTKSGNVTVIR